MANYLLGLLIVFVLPIPHSHSQQQYSGNSVMDCNNNDGTGSSPAFLYSCNIHKPSCEAFLTFRTQPPHDSVSSIAKLLSADFREFSRLNNISNRMKLPPEQEVIVPVSCSCSGRYFQAITSYVTQTVYDTYFIIANYTYQGLSTCNALMQENPYGELDLVPGLDLRVPLRCACPTKDQIANGTKFLLTYIVTWGDKIPLLADRFNVSVQSIAYANGFSDSTVLFPFTTILIPLPREPVSFPRRAYRPTVSRTPQHRHKRSHRGLYVSIGIGGSLAVLCFILFLSFSRYRMNITDPSCRGRRVKKNQQLPEHVLDSVFGADQMLKIYELEELKTATEDFSPHKRLSNTVYRGILRGKLLAVKKTNRDVSMEIYILRKINHFNLISLQGACESNEASFLVYEFMENGCLKDWLHKEDWSELRDWNLRIRIALDVANGVDYLHNFTAPAYVHQDINSSNILLNTNLRAKIANFGLARLIDMGEDGNSQTSCVLGAKGYMAPEYLQAGKVTPKIDVYAFGVVLLELITGREAVFMLDEKEVLLSEAVVSAMEGRNSNLEFNSLIDPRLQVKHPLSYIIDHSELALRLIRLSLACLVDEPANRLSMAEIVSSLMKIQLDVRSLNSFSVE